MGQTPVRESDKQRFAFRTYADYQGRAGHGYVGMYLHKANIAPYDGLFGDTAGRDTAKAENKLRWSNEPRAEKGKSLGYRSSFRAHLRLPRPEKMVRLVIMEENREEAVAPMPGDPGTPVVNSPTKANALRAVDTEFCCCAHDTKAGYAFLAAGSPFVWLPEIFVRARFLRRHTLVDNTVIRPSVTRFGRTISASE